VGVNCRKRISETIERQAELAGVLRDKGRTDQAARIETELVDSTRALAALPAIGAADPQAEGAAALVGWITAGRVVLSAHDVTMIRTAGLTLMPALAGLLFVSHALCQPGRRELEMSGSAAWLCHGERPGEDNELWSRNGEQGDAEHKITKHTRQLVSDANPDCEMICYPCHAYADKKHA
jgi:hypothetical protein